MVSETAQRASMILWRLCQVTLFAIGVITLLVGGQANAASFHAIICGSGGEVAYQERFRAWGADLRNVLLQQLGNEPGRVFLLTESTASMAINPGLPFLFSQAIRTDTFPSAPRPRFPDFFPPTRASSSSMISDNL